MSIIIFSLFSFKKKRANYFKIVFKDFLLNNNGVSKANVSDNIAIYLINVPIREVVQTTSFIIS